MSNNNVVFILPINNIATYLYNKTFYRLSVFGVTPPPKEWFLNYCKTLTNDIINRRLVWQQSHTAGYNSDTLVDELSTYTDNSAEVIKQAGEILLTILGEAEPQLQHFINLHVPNRSWKVWIVKDFFDDIVVEEGEDYRILEFNRIMEERALSMAQRIDEGNGSINGG